MKVSFELSPRDLRFFRDRLKQVRASQSARDESLVIRGAASLVEEAIETKPPDFVIKRIRKLERLIEMLEDEQWRLEGRDRTRVLDALAYFVDPDDLIPDRIPGIGYLDDAIMVELVARELTHDMAAYEDFCEYRRRHPNKKLTQEQIEKRRDALQARMRRRQRRERSAQRTRGASESSRLRLW